MHLFRAFTAALCVGLLVISSAARAEEPALVTNPGFEDGLAGWQVDNWAKNEIAVAPDSDRPHSGKTCARVELKRVVNEANLQFATGALALHADRAVEIRFWARGISNSPAITTLLRRSDKPYTGYFRCDTTLIDEWREFVYLVTVPAEAVQYPISLRFWLNAPGVFWLDDVSVRELPAASDEAAPSTNPVRNPSFEVGTDGWSATIRAKEFPEAWQESGSNAPCPAEVHFAAVEVADAPHGRRQLEIDIPNDGFATLTSAFFVARYGHRARLSASLRGPAGAEVWIGIGGGKNGNARFQGAAKVCTTAWQTMVHEPLLKPVEGDRYCVQVRFTVPGRYMLDDVQVIEDDAKDVTLHPAAAALVAPEGTPLGHLFAREQAAQFRLEVADVPANTTSAWRWLVEDHLDQQLASGTCEVLSDASGRGTALIDVPTAHYGAFRLSAHPVATAGLNLLAEQLYSVLPELSAPATRPDSFFGGHVDFTPYNLEIARKAGFRWLRLHPPLSTKWMAVEPQPGTWIFRTGAITAAHQAGFRILGSLDTAPTHAEVADPERTKPSRWARSYPPANLTAWQDYVERTVRAFGPTIDAWELWNEPDGGFLQVPRGMDKTAVYLGLLRATRMALDRVDPRITLLGPALASPTAPLGSEVLAQGGGQLLDGFTFHCYSLSSGGASPDDATLLPWVGRVNAYRDRHGLSLPVWHSEGGVWLAGGQSRLTSWQVPVSSGLTPSAAAAAMVRAALMFKASGVRRYFDFQAWASPSGRKSTEDNCCGFIEVTGIPGAGIAAHAAMVALTEDALPAGFHVTPHGAGKVREARFTTTNGALLSAWWSDATLPLAAVAGNAGQVWDLMGNPIALADATVGEYPVYTLRAEP